VFYFAKPDLVRWQYTQGPPQIVVGDGHWIWVYQSDLVQVYKIDYTGAFGHGGLVALLAGRAGLASRYDASLAESGDTTVKMTLHGKGTDEVIEIEMDAKTFDLSSVVVTDAAGSTTQMSFDDVLRNGHIDPKLFTFSPPPGIDIVEQSEVGF